ncbi:MAG: GIY-YIG nuclease family protein [Chitinispirillaceae bacterium]|nr:GIY-YIG nuclease family protein [Chitinispirillaceae bacterium]
MQRHDYYIYILTNINNKVMYIGVTNNLTRRLFQHQSKTFPGFTAQYNVNKLVYFEHTNDIKVAIKREKTIKGWRREKKNELVSSLNPEWKDLGVNWERRDSSFHSE